MAKPKWLESNWSALMYGRKEMCTLYTVQCKLYMNDCVEEKEKKGEFNANSTWFFIVSKNSVYAPDNHKVACKYKISAFNLAC